MLCESGIVRNCPQNQHGRNLIREKGLNIERYTETPSRLKIGSGNIDVKTETPLVKFQRIWSVGTRDQMLMPTLVRGTKCWYQRWYQHLVRATKSPETPRRLR